MSEEIEQSWARVTRWLQAHAPASYATLRPPATPADIEDCEEVLGLPLSPEHKRLLLVNNGAADFGADGEYCRGAAFLPGDQLLLSAAEAAKQSRSITELLGDFDEFMTGSWWHPQWVLFGTHIAGDGLAIDLRPGPEQGAVGEFMHEGDTEFTMAPSLGAFMTKLADCLANETDFSYFRPVIEDGELSWEVLDATDYEDE